MDTLAHHVRQRLLLVLGVSASQACSPATRAEPPTSVIALREPAPGGVSQPTARRPAESPREAESARSCGRDELAERVCVAPPPADSTGGVGCAATLDDVMVGTFSRPVHARLLPPLAEPASRDRNTCCYEWCSPVRVAVIEVLACSAARRRMVCAIAPAGGTSAPGDWPLAGCPAGVIGVGPEAAAVPGRPRYPAKLDPAVTQEKRLTQRDLCCYEHCAPALEIQRGRPLRAGAREIVAALAFIADWVEPLVAIGAGEEHDGWHERGYG